MKKTIKHTLTAIMLLSSFNVSAMNESNTDSFDMMEGKIAATAMMNMQILIEESQKQVDEIKGMGELIGQSMEDSHGLLKFIGEKETFAEMALNEMKMLDKKKEKMTVDGLIKAQARISSLAGEIRAMNEETQTTLDKILGAK